MKKILSLFIVIAASFLLVASTDALGVSTPPGWLKWPENVKEKQEERLKNLEELKNLRQQVEARIKALLRRKIAITNGQITAIAGTTLTVEKNGQTYTVLTGEFVRCTTRFLRRFWGRSTLAEMAVGDLVHVIGYWQDEEKTTIEACLIRDKSIQKRHGVFVGTVVSLTASGWVMDPVGEKRPNQTVTVSSSTKFVNRKNQPITQADIQVGHRVRVKGLWNMRENTLTEVTHVKDYSLPPRPTISPSP